MSFELKLAWKYFRARRKSLARFTSAVAVLGIAAGVASLIIAQALARGFADEMRDKILANTAHISVFLETGGEIANYREIEEKLKKIENVREVCAKENLTEPKIIGVTVLTSANRETLREVGIDKEIDSQVVNLARLTAKCGLDGVVASPLEVETIRSTIEKPNFLIVTPGIRPSFATNDDQKRVMTPAEAVAKGADYLVIGRPITAQSDKLSAVRQIIKETEIGKTTDF